MTVPLTNDLRDGARLWHPCEHCGYVPILHEASRCERLRHAAHLAREGLVACWPFDIVRSLRYLGLDIFRVDYSPAREVIDFETLEERCSDEAAMRVVMNDTHDQEHADDFDGMAKEKVSAHRAYLACVLEWSVQRVLYAVRVARDVRAGLSSGAAHAAHKKSSDEALVQFISGKFNPPIYMRYKAPRRGGQPDLTQVQFLYWLPPVSGLALFATQDKSYVRRSFQYSSVHHAFVVDSTVGLNGDRPVTGPWSTYEIDFRYVGIDDATHVP